MVTYVKKNSDGEWVNGKLPSWKNEDGTDLTEEQWNEHGYFQLVPTVHDDSLEFRIGKVVEGSPSTEWVFKDNKVIPTFTISDLELDEIKAKAYNILNGEFESFVDGIRGDYPESEQSTWATQEREVNDWRKDPNVDTPLLSAIAEARNLPLDQLRTLAAQQVDNYVLAMGRAVGCRQKYRDAIHESADVGSIVVVLESIEFGV